MNSAQGSRQEVGKPRGACFETFFYVNTVIKSLWDDKVILRKTPLRLKVCVWLTFFLTLFFTNTTDPGFAQV